MTARPKRGSTRKQSRKILTEKRHLLRYRALHSTKECGSPLPCICRFSAILRCCAVSSKPLFSYVTRADTGVVVQRRGDLGLQPLPDAAAAGLEQQVGAAALPVDLQQAAFCGMDSNRNPGGGKVVSYG